MAEGTQALTARGLRKRYGNQPVLQGIDLELRAGETTVILGENGAGKTTLLRVLAGDLLADEGQVHVQGHDLGSDPDGARAHLVYVAQHPPLAPLLTLREHARAMMGFRGLDPTLAEPRLQSLADRLHLGHALDRPVRALSGGMAHKAALVLAFLAEAKVVVLDEPHAGLDVRSALALRALIQQHRDQGRAFLLASHLAEATLALADRAMVLRAGQVALTLQPGDLRAFGGDARAFEGVVLQAMEGR